IDVNHDFPISHDSALGRDGVAKRIPNCWDSRAFHLPRTKARSRRYAREAYVESLALCARSCSSRDAGRSSPREIWTVAKRMSRDVAFILPQYSCGILPRTEGDVCRIVSRGDH